jgi:hypothetical protein
MIRLPSPFFAGASLGSRTSRTRSDRCRAGLRRKPCPLRWRDRPPRRRSFPRVEPGDAGALIRRALIRRPANPAEVRMRVERGDGTSPAKWTAMKKSTRRLALRAQTIRLLADEALPAVLGGGQVGVGDQGFIMKDSIIVPTSRR